MPKVCIIGAGSTVFAAELVSDILCTPSLPEGTIALVDIDPERLELAHQMVEHLIGISGRAWSVAASTDRTRVLTSSDYVINTIEVAGLPNVRHDYDIPLKYGVDQCIGDTIGPGGLFKALRTLPAWLEILKDIEQLAPDSLVLNYTNPMSIMTLAGLRASILPIVGLCHSIQHTAHQLASYMGIPPSELHYRAAGVNHLAWFVELSRDGQDLYPLLYERAGIPEIYEKDPVRFDMMLQLGTFVSESSGHASEYLPYYRKRPDLLRRYMRTGYLGESGFYANNWPGWRAWGDQRLRKVLAGEEEYPLQRGVEFAATIVEARQTGQPANIYGNVPNTGLIDNLPQDGVVEVLCEVDEDGVRPVPFGQLPGHLAALCQQHMAFHDLVVTSVLEQDREAAVHALMIDPLSGAVCSLDEMRSMFDEMVAAQRAYLPDYIVR